MAPASVMSPSFGLSEPLAACVFVYEAASFNRRPSLIPAHLLFYFLFLFLFCSFCRRSVWCTLRAAPNGPPLMIDLNTLISGGMLLLAAGLCPCDQSVNEVLLSKRTKLTSKRFFCTEQQPILMASSEVSWLDTKRLFASSFLWYFVLGYVWWRLQKSVRAPGPEGNSLRFLRRLFWVVTPFPPSELMNSLLVGFYWPKLGEGLRLIVAHLCKSVMFF